MCVDWGYLHASAPGCPGQAGDRGVIVPMKPVKTDGGKGARKIAVNAGWRRNTRWCHKPKPGEKTRVGTVAIHALLGAHS